MDPIIFDDIADSFLKLRTYPYFDIAHYILMSIEVKDDTPQSGSVQFSRRHPFACWFSTMLMCFGGAILSNFVCGYPLFTSFDDTKAVITATVVWYLINFFPFDIIYRLCKCLPVRLVICTLKEILRAKKILIGVHHGIHEFPSSPTMGILLGLLKGCGSVKIRPLSQFIMGTWEPRKNPMLVLNFTSKISFLAALAYYLHYIELIPVTENQLFLAVASAFVYLRVVIILMGFKDPLAPFENVICTILFGGTVDALRNAFERSRSVNVNGPVSSNPTVSGSNPSASTGTAGGNVSSLAPGASSISANGQAVMRDVPRQSTSDKKRD